MSIHFACDRCGHPIDVDARLTGKAGHCKHCGHTLTVPAAEPAAPESPPIALKLRPVEGAAPPASRAPTAPGPALHVRPLAATPPTVAAPKAVDATPIEILDPDGRVARPSRRVPLNPHYETRAARWLAARLRVTRDRLYLASLALLVATLIGFLFKLKAVMHLGTVGVVLANLLMLVDGICYLLVLPFRESLAQGLATLFPPYALAYWVKHWGQLRKPVLNTLASFTPILLAGIAYACYEEAPVILREVERADRAVEKALGVQPGPASAPEPRQPSVADQAKEVLGGEANVIQQLAQPQ